MAQRAWFNTNSYRIFHPDIYHIQTVGKPVWICFCINISYFIHTQSDSSIISLLDTQYIMLHFSYLAFARFSDWITCLIHFLSVYHSVRTFQSSSDECSIFGCVKQNPKPLVVCTAHISLIAVLHLLSSIFILLLAFIWYKPNFGRNFYC